MTPTSHTRDSWRLLPNTQETATSDYMLRHGKRMHRLCRLVARVEMPNDVELPAERPVIFAANHRSYLDIAVALAMFGNFSLTCRMQVRADMFERPVIGSWLRKLGCIPTSTALREQAEAVSIETLQAGSTVAIMPEGRLVPARDRPDGVGEPRTGVARIAAQTRAMIIPVAIYGSDDIWPKGRPIPKLGLFKRRRLVVELGPPMSFDLDDHQANADQLMERIAEMLAEIEARIST